MIQPRRILLLAVFAAVLVLLPSRAAAQAVLTDDAFTTSTTPTKNYGYWITLNVNSTSHTYLKFDLSRVSSAGITPQEVTQATLRLWVDPFEAPGAIDVYEVNSPWSEATITWANAPTLNSTPAVADMTIATASQLHYITVDVTALVQAWLTNPASNQGLALVAHPNTGISVLFDSKENIFTAHEPELDIVASGPAGTPGTAATVAIGTTTTVGTGGQAAVSNVGTPSAAILNFSIPQGVQGAAGQTGPAGQAATIKVEPSMTVPYGTPASVMNGGTSRAADLTFLIPQGPVGAPGLPGAPGQQGPAGINNRGNWISGNSYNPSDAVSYSNSFWMATAADNGSQAPSANSNWQLLAAGINNRGAWNAANSYTINDAVTDGGSYWLALLPTSPNTSTSCKPAYPPDPCGTDWQLLAAAGAAGTQGAQGAMGQTGAPGPQGIQGPIGIQGSPGSMPAGAAQTSIANTFTASQTINGNLILGGTGNGVQFADGSILTTAASGSASSLMPAFLPGPLTKAYTAASFAPDSSITVTRISAVLKTAPDPFCPPSILRVTNGSTGQDVRITGGQSAKDTGPMTLPTPAGTNLEVQVQTPANCAQTNPGDANVLVEYRGQRSGDTQVCAESGLACNGICEETQTDSNNCGACSVSCPSGQTCVAGACSSACVTCGSSCSLLSSDRNNCGACGNVCGFIADGFGGGVLAACVSGVCTNNCPGTRDCSGFCVNTHTDPNNCGNCGSVCAAGLVCSGGVCTLPNLQ